MSEPQGEPSVSELMVRGIVVGVFAENCWVIGSRRSREAIALDPGDQPVEILQLAREMGVTIKLIANTHAHVDHILGVREVQRASGARFLLHAADLDLARSAALEAQQWLGQQLEPPPDPDAFLDEGDEVEVAGVKLKVIHTPGHTRGSLSFYTDGMLFSGDTLFRGSVGRTDFPEGDHEQEMRSIVDKLLRLPDETVVLPGHMNETRIGLERQTNPFIHQELARRRRSE